MTLKTNRFFFPFVFYTFILILTLPFNIALSDIPRDTTILAMKGRNNLQSERYAIYRNDIKFFNMRNFGAILSTIPFAYYYDLGHSGQAAYFSFRGLNANFSEVNIDYFPLTSFINQSVDLNFLPLSRIDSVFFINSVKSFLFSPRNSNASIILFNSDTLSKKPVSRFKFSQSAFDENYLDVDYNYLIAEKTNLSLYVETQANENRFSNSSFEIWKAGFSLRRDLDSNNRIYFSYSHLRNKSFLYGGVDFDSIFRSGKNGNSFYDEVFAPVLTPDLTSIYSDNYYKTSWVYDNDNFRSFSSIFIRSEKLQIKRFNSYDIIPIYESSPKLSAYSYGFVNNINLDFNLLSYSMKNNYFETKNIIAAKEKHNSILSSSSELTRSFFNSKITTSLFGKISYLSEKDILTGYGADLKYKITNSVSFYAGFSKTEIKNENLYALYDFYKLSKKKFIAHNYETSLNFKSNWITINLAGFYSKFDYHYAYASNQYISLPIIEYRFPSIYGANLNWHANIKPFLIKTNINLISSNKSELINPKVYAYSGIYYENLFFNENFFLYVGIDFLFYGKRPFAYPNFASGIIANYFYKNESLKIAANDINRDFELSKKYNLSSIPSDYTANFVFFGEIQKSAVIFLVIENILNRKYFLVPVYPMRERTLRLGVEWMFIN